jgi:hypothetical protein
MKKSIFLVTLLVSFNTFAWFKVNAQMWVNPLNVSATVSNNFGYPIFCQGTVYGLTRNGFQAFANFAPQWIPAGTYRTAFVYTNIYNPFINGSSQIYCR